MIAPQIYGKKVVNCYYANYGTFGLHGSKEYYITGYVIVYSNGYKTVCGGGSRAGIDFHELTLLDKNNKIVEQYEEQ
jgi:hypothetical protein